MNLKIVAAAAVLSLGLPLVAQAQSIRSGADDGAHTGRHVAGPVGGLVGGVVGGAVGGAEGAVKGALGVPRYHHRCHWHHGRRYC